MRKVPVAAVLGLALLCWIFSVALSNQKILLHGVPLYALFLALSVILLLWCIALFTSRERR